MPASSPASRYWELTLEISDEVEEALTNFLWELGALGVVEQRENAREPTLRAFFPDTAAPDVLTARVTAYSDALRGLGFAAPPPPSVALLVDEGWAEAWRAHFRPIAVGRRLVIVPPWDASTEPGRIRIVIEPGRAFGTGHHATTAGCLEAIDEIVERDRPARAIDLGTGTGILAIAAAKLGVASVLAVDEDPDAIAALDSNARQNGVEARVTPALANADSVRTEASPLVVANLLTAAHRRLAPRYVELVVPGGALVLGGVLEAEGAAVADAVGPGGFASCCTRVMDGWVTMHFTRIAGTAAGAPVHDRA